MISQSLRLYLAACAGLVSLLLGWALSRHRHSWGRWEAYEATDDWRCDNPAGTWTQRQWVRQKRSCATCGYTQDQHVKDGPLSKEPM